MKEFLSRPYEMLSFVSFNIALSVMSMQRTRVQAMKTHFLLFRENLKHKQFWKAVAEINNTLECWTCKKLRSLTFTMSHLIKQCLTLTFKMFVNNKQVECQELYEFCWHSHDPRTCRVFRFYLILVVLLQNPFQMYLLTIRTASLHAFNVMPNILVRVSKWRWKNDTMMLIFS